MEFTQIERVSIARVLIDLMNADGNVDIRETLYMNQIRNVLNITDAEIQAGKNQNILISLLALKSMNNEKKYALGVMLTEMINADGKVDNNELKYFNIICKAIEMEEIIKEKGNK